jgi:hypothetical protein
MSDIHALSGAYAIDALESDERELFRQHLAQCPDCQAEVDSLREAAALLPETTSTPPPPALRDRVLAEIATVRPLPPEVGKDEAIPFHERVEPTAAVIPLARRRRFRLALVAAAAVAALIGGGVVASQPWQDDTSEQQLSLADQVLRDPRATHVRLDFDGGATATVTRSEKHGRAVIVTSKMPAAPEGKVYELWLQVDGDMVPAGVMPRKPDQTVLLEGDANLATAVGITVEPGPDGSEEPTSPPIATFELEA